MCNRYCGGSHTVTTPQQRVARVGHFLEQWGPEIAPVNDTHVRGTDGQVRFFHTNEDRLTKSRCLTKIEKQFLVTKVVFTMKH